MQDYLRLTDEQLVSKIRSANPQMYRHLVDRYQDKLMRYAVYLSRDTQKAADIVQETFIKAYVNLNAFDTRKKFSSWIYRIAHNESINSIKKHHREQPFVADSDIGSDTDLEAEFTRTEIARLTHKCLADLPVIYAEPLSLYYLEDKSYAEISDILRLPIGTISIRISRAKARMKVLCQNIK